MYGPANSEDVQGSTPCPQHKAKREVSAKEEIPRIIFARFFYKGVNMEKKVVEKNEFDRIKFIEARHSDPNETREEYIAKCEAEGLVVCYPKEDELFIDIDNEKHYEEYQRTSAILFREADITQVKETISKSGTGKHIRIKMPFAMSDVERIAWQAALGSDPVRELLSMLRYMEEDTQPTLFVEAKGWIEDGQ